MALSRAHLEGGGGGNNVNIHLLYCRLLCSSAAGRRVDECAFRSLCILAFVHISFCAY